MAGAALESRGRLLSGEQQSQQAVLLMETAAVRRRMHSPCTGCKPGLDIRQGTWQGQVEGACKVLHITRLVGLFLDKDACTRQHKPARGPALTSQGVQAGLWCVTWDSHEALLWGGTPRWQ